LYEPTVGIYEYKNERKKFTASVAPIKRHYVTQYYCDPLTSEKFLSLNTICGVNAVLKLASVGVHNNAVCSITQQQQSG